MTQPLLVTAAIIMDRQRVLLTRRSERGSYPGLWEFPGGKVEAGESPEQALARELAEELGVGICVGDIYQVVYHRYPWGPVLILAYLSRIVQGAIRNQQVADHCWVAAHELDRFQILPADQPIRERLRHEPLLRKTCLPGSIAIL